MPSAKPDLPAHINDMIVTMSQLHVEHRRRADPFQKRISAVHGALGRPALLVILTGVIASWIALNVALLALGRAAPDPPPFAYLDGAATLAALYLAATIVITQRHEDELATHRDQLTLQLAILSDQKSAKIIQLLEELRRIDPAQRHYTDAEAEALATPVDPKAVMAQIRATHSALQDDASPARSAGHDNAASR
jgi:uncharacterized membrane protein